MVNAVSCCGHSGRERVTPRAVERKGEQRYADPLAIELSNRPGDSLHEMVPGRKAVDEDRHWLALDPQVQRSKQRGLIVAMASVLVLDILEHQRVDALPAPLGEADAVGREPALLDVDPPRRGKQLARVAAVRAVVVARGKRGQVVHELRRLLQIGRLELGDLRDEEAVRFVRELLNQPMRPVVAASSSLPLLRAIPLALLTCRYPMLGELRLPRWFRPISEPGVQCNC